MSGFFHPGWSGLAMLLLLSSPARAAIDAYQFQDPVNEQRFRTLVQELRCPKCQNQNIADSNAPLAKDLRDRTYEMIQAGRADQEIMAFMTERYGDFITYRPPLRPITWLLWFGPGLGVALAALGIGLWVRRRRPAPALDEPDRRRVEALLKRHGEDAP